MREEKMITDKNPVTPATDIASLQAFRGWNNEPEWMKNLRQRAKSEYLGMPWPDRRDEEWFRTSIDSLKLHEKRTYAVAEKETTEVKQPSLGLSGQIVLKDGLTVSLGLDKTLQEKGVHLVSLRQAVVSSEGTVKQEGLKEILEKLIENLDAKPQPLHTALIDSGVLVVIPANCILDKPLLIDITETRPESLSCPHIVINAGRLSQAEVIIRYKAQGNVTLNPGVTAILDEAAVLKLSEIQEVGDTVNFLSFNQVRQNRDSQLTYWNASLGGQTVKSRVIFDLNGEGAQLKAYGIYFGICDQHKDIRIVQNHNAPHTSSSTLYKGAVRDRSRTIFQGLIEVKPLASKTDAYLSNRNLVLTDGARAESLPQLKINTDDVKCSHGSTTGKVNEDELFYLTSRGFSEVEAKLFIAEGLFDEVIREAPELLKAELEERVSFSLGHEGTCYE